MLAIKQSSLPWVIAGVISVIGIFAQQTALVCAGAGLAVGTGSTGSRRKDGESSHVVRGVADLDRKYQALDKNFKVVLARVSIQDTQIKQLTTDSIIDQETVRQLTAKVQNQQTRLNLQVKAIQKAQQDNHSNRAIIATQARDNNEDRAKIEELTSLLQQNSSSASKPPVTHLLIDGNAMRFIKEEIGSFNYQALQQILTKGASEVKCKFYLGDTGTYAQKQFVFYLEKIGFEVFLFPIVRGEGGQLKTKGDDVKIAIDAVNVSPGDRVILCGGGDADFFPVVNRLKEMEIDFTVVAYLKTTGAALKHAAGKNLVDLEAIQAECIASYN